MTMTSKQRINALQDLLAQSERALAKRAQQKEIADRASCPLCGVRVFSGNMTKDSEPLCFDCYVEVDGEARLAAAEEEDARLVADVPH